MANDVLKSESRFSDGGFNPDPEEGPRSSWRSSAAPRPGWNVWPPAVVLDVNRRGNLTPKSKDSQLVSVPIGVEPTRRITAYDTLAAAMASIFGPEGILSSPFWFVAEGAIVGLVIGFAATRFGGEGPETVAQAAAVR